MKNTDYALRLACAEAGLDRDLVELLRAERQDGLYYIHLQDLWMQWEFYVDTENGFVPGLLSTPRKEAPTGNENYSTAAA